MPPRAEFTTELLAPAGDWDCLRAAAANGADAVYFGLAQFNARHRATNFALGELREVIDWLHARNVRGYVTLNTLVFSDELPELADTVAEIAQAGADAVIVQDLGLARLVHELAPDLPIHGSTQMTLTEPRGIEFVQRLGIERVILARELSVDNIATIRAATDMPVEVFVHGALCVAYSGQCLTSEALGGRSANRGQCAQACRLPYDLIVDGQGRELGDVAYLLSPQDLAAHDLVDRLVELGVSCLKIEGRLKSAQYVAVTTQTYRAALDAARERQPFVLSPQGERDLVQSFSRGFTPGFLQGVNHQRLVHGRFPKARGVRAGTVVAATPRGVLVELAAEDVIGVLKPGDGVVFDEGHPEQDEQGGRLYAVQSVPPSDGGARRVVLEFARGAVNLSALAPGSIVWRTDDPEFRRRMDRTFAVDVAAKRTPLDVTIAGNLGQELRVTCTAAKSSATVAWPGPLARALKHPLDSGTVREQFGRLTETPFELRHVTLDLPEPTMVPKSVLNDLRRRAVQQLMQQRTTADRGRRVDTGALARLRDDAAQRAASPPLAQPRLHVLVRTMEQLLAVLAHPSTPTEPDGAPLVYCDFEDVRRYREAVARARAAGRAIGLATLRVLKPGEDGWLHHIAHAGADAVLVRNLASLEFFRSQEPRPLLVGDYSLNVANELTADLFCAAGLARLVPSYDLNWEQLTAMLARHDPAPFEIVVHQHMPMFHMEHCVFAAMLSSGRDWRDCGRPCDHHRVELRDRVGAEFPLVADTGCRNTVFNSVPQSAAEYIPRMLSLGLRHFRVELLRETAAETQALLDRYAGVLAGRENARNAWRGLQVLNQLGVTRGTLR